MPFNLACGDPFAYSINNAPANQYPFTDTSGRSTISATLDPAKNNFVAIIEGQSVAANHIPNSYTVLNPTKVNSVNWAGDRLLYQHQEPIFGATYYVSGQVPANNWNAPYISLWGKVGDLLINSGKFDRVIWLNTAINGAIASKLEPGGICGRRVPTAFYVLRSLGITADKVSAVISMEGESDATASTSAVAFMASRNATFRAAKSLGFAGKWFTPLETLTLFTVTSATIRQAQVDLAAQAGFVQGPDFDTLTTSTYRDTTGAHPNILGHDTMAQMWADNISANF